MAAIGIAYPQDAYAGAYNPAGIVDVGDRIDASAAWIQDHGHAKLTDNLFPAPGINSTYNSFRTKDIYNADFGINKTFCSEYCGEYWSYSVGLVVYNRDFQKTTYTRPIPILGTSKQGGEYLHQTIAPLFAVRINDCHSIGVSLDIHLQRAKIDGAQNFDTPAYTVSPGHVTNKGYSYSSGVGATFGWKWDITQCFNVGLTYRTKNTMRRFHKYRGFFAQRGRLNVPEKWGAGLAFKFRPDTTVAFDVEWINWGNVKSLHNPLLHNGTLELLGTTKGPGFGAPNQTFYRVGLDYRFNEYLTLRAGYRHTNCFVRRSQTAINVFTCDTVKDYITFGATYAWNVCNEFSFFYAHGFNNLVRGRNSIPLAFGGGEGSLKESKIALGLSWGYQF